MKAEKQWLFFPVKTGAPKRNVDVLVDGIVQRHFEIELADATPDWFAPLEIARWQDHDLTVQVDHLPERSRAMELLVQADALLGGENLYQEAWRGQLHFSARRGWINDANGMVYAQGEYHLFFQLNPYGWNWGNMHWGHAVSRDLVSWNELPIALYPHARDDAAFSGSAVVDRGNTSGWGDGADDPLAAAYTSTRRGECMIYSNDRGRSWQEFEANPVIRHAGRDPRLLWHAPTCEWVMVVYSPDPAHGKQAADGLDFYTSPDLKHWTWQSHVTGFFECPDLFERPVEDSASQENKWVLMGANTDYMIGSFDGKTFAPETPKLTGQRGKGFYGAQTFSNEPQRRIVQIGWLHTSTPGMPFNGSMSLPHTLSLRATAAGPRLVWLPVDELHQLRTESLVVGPLAVTPEAANPLEGISGELLEMRARFSKGEAREITFNVRGVPIVYDTGKQELNVNGMHAAAPWQNDEQNLIIYADRTGLEIFASHGLCYLPMPMNLAPANHAADLRVSGGKVVFNQLEVHRLKSIWQ